MPPSRPARSGNRRCDIGSRWLHPSHRFTVAAAGALFYAAVTAAAAMQVCQVWTLRDRKVVHVTGGYRDRSEALEAAGLKE